MDDSMKALLEEFIAESKEHLSSLEEDFLELEKQKDDPDKDLVNKVFRAIHTIKGTSGFFGLDNITELSHKMENILSAIRNEEMRPESDIIDILLTGADIINTMIDDVEHSNEMDIADVVADLQAIMDREGNEVEEIDTEIELKDKDGKKVGFILDLFILNNIPKEYGNLFLLKLELSDMSKYSEGTPTKFVDALAQKGSILNSNTTTLEEDFTSGMPIGPIFYDLIYATGLSKSELEKEFKIVNEEVVVLDAKAAGLAEEKVVVEAEPKQEDTKIVTDETKLPVQSSDNEKQVAKPAANKAQKGGSEGSFIRIHVDLLDRLMRLASELVLVRNQELLLVNMNDPVARNNMQRLDIVTSELQEAIMLTRMQPIGNIFNKFNRIVRELGKKLDKSIDIHITGNEVELDKTILESLTDPLTHIIRNSCDHGVETPEEREAKGKSPKGNIWLKAYHEGGQINIEVRDDGKGIDPAVIKRKVLEKGLKTVEELDAMGNKELISLVMMAGFSTAEKLSDVSGRGVGMDVVKAGIEKLNGSIDLDSRVNEGTKIILRLPLTLAIIPCLIVKVGGYRYAIPQVNLEELVSLYDKDVKDKIECASDKEIFRLRNQLLTMIRLKEVLERSEPFNENVRASITEKYRNHQIEFYADEENKKTNYSQSLNFAVLKIGLFRFGLIVDEVLGTEEIVVKPMHPVLKSLRVYSGSTVMGDGKVALILDVEGIARHTGILFDSGKSDAEDTIEKTTDKDNTQTILLFKNGETEQFAVALPLIRRIEKINVSEIEQIGMKEFITIDGLSTRVLRLDTVLNVSPTVDKEDSFLLLPKHTGKPFGILASSLTDIEESTFELNTESYKEDGLLGTSIIRDHMTLFIDIYRLIEVAEPEWFIKKERMFKSDMSPIKVLMLEDSSFFRELVKGYLESDGCEVTACENGIEGLDQLYKDEYDIIVSDIEMPGMGGIEFIENVRKDEKYKDMLAIALTSLDSDEDRQRALKAGYNDYRVKIEREHFLKAINELLTKHAEEIL